MQEITKGQHVNPDDFLKEHPPKIRQSRLTPAWPAIQKMRAAGSSLADIKTFLELNGITTSLPNLSLFIKRQMQEDRKKPDKPKIGSTENDAESQTPEPLPENTSDASTTDQALGDTSESSEEAAAEKVKRLSQKRVNPMFEKFGQTPPKKGNS